jgi:hypothetical protein
MKAYGMDEQIHVFLPSTLAEGEWPASYPGSFTLGEKPTGTHWIGGWVGPRTDLDDVEKRKILPLPGLQAVQPVAIRYTDFVITKLWEHPIVRNFWIFVRDYSMWQVNDVEHEQSLPCFG